MKTLKTVAETMGCTVSELIDFDQTEREAWDLASRVWDF